MSLLMAMNIPEPNCRIVMPAYISGRLLKMNTPTQATTRPQPAMKLPSTQIHFPSMKAISGAVTAKPISMPMVIVPKMPVMATGLPRTWLQK